MQGANMQANKNPAILFLTLTLMTLAATARKADAGGIGPLAGANFANADVDGRNTRSITGWAIGARLETGILPFLKVMVDPMFLQDGAEFDADGTSGSGRGRFTNLEVPLLLTPHLGLGGLGLYAFMGPDLVFNTSSSGHVASDNDLNSGVSKVGLSGQVGAGISLNIAPTLDLTADARYSHGFTDLLDGAKGDVHHWRSRDVRLTAGLLFHALP